MSASEMGCGKEETGKEDAEEERASDLNINNEETRVKGKVSTFSLPENNNRDQNAGENVDLQTENNDVKGLGLPTDSHGSVDNQTPADDANINANVDQLHGINADVELESLDNNENCHESSASSQELVDSTAHKANNNDSVHVNANELSGSKNDVSLVVESAAPKTDDNASVDVNANEVSGSKNDGSVVESAAAKTNNNASVDVNANKLFANKNDGSVVNSLNQLERVAADKKSSEIKAENDEKGVKLDDASAVDVSANVHLLNQLEGAAADERSSEIKAENDKGEKLDDASLVDVTSNKLSGCKLDGSHTHLLNQLDHAAAGEESSDIKAEDDEKGEELNGVADMELSLESDIKESKPEVDVDCDVSMKSSNLSFLYEPPVAEGDESGTEEEQAAFVKEVENFYKERSLEFKHPKFYKEDLNLLKLWRAVIRLGGYEEVTSCKLWRQVGESFNPPKTCTTVSWTFRIFYEKALLDYEKHRMNNGECLLRDVSLPETSRIDSQASGCQAFGSGRARRDAAARAMQGWHSKRLLGSGEVCQPIIKEKNSSCTPKSDKHIKYIGMLKRKKPSSTERTIQVANIKATNPQSDTMVIDVGPPADWVKINVQRTSDCFEVYALVPGLLREEVHVQSDPAGRLVISGQPEQLDNPWGVTPFKKVVSLPSRIDPHQTSAVVTLHGQLFVRVPFEQSDL